MIRGVLLIALLIFSSPTLADYVGGTLNERPPRSHRTTDDLNLDRAMKWCDEKHSVLVYNGSLGGNVIYGYSTDDCRKVEAAWEKSSIETARREAERAAEQAANEAWFRNFVKDLGP